MMIHAALRWSDDSEKILWTMAMSHTNHLHNHTPHISSSRSPEEILTRSNSSHSALKNYLHGDALHMSWNQDCMIITSCLRGCQGLGELNIWEPPLYIPEQWDASETYRL